MSGIAYCIVIIAAKDDSLLGLSESFGQIRGKCNRSISEQICALVLKKLRAASRLRIFRRLEEDRTAAATTEDISVIQYVNEFCEHVSHVTQYSTAQFEVSGRTENDLVPQFSTKRMQFKRVVAPRDSSLMRSDTIDLDGIGWRVKLFPYRNADIPSAHSSLFIELVHGFQEPTNAHWIDSHLIRRSDRLGPGTGLERVPRMTWGHGHDP
jgi:hypothetical protein